MHRSADGRGDWICADAIRAVVFAVFTALALGLAAPYLLLSWQPAWVRVLPRPGAWMELLKQFTAVPLFATANLAGVGLRPVACE